MKKIGFITTNKVLAQSLSTVIRTRPELEFAFYSLLNPGQATLDSEVLKIDVALIDVMESADREMNNVSLFCEELRQVVPLCRILLLVSQEEKKGRKMAIAAVKRHQADDFVFYDTSLDYLVAKLSAI